MMFSTPITTTTTTTTTTPAPTVEEIIFLMAPTCSNETAPTPPPGQVCEGGAENCTLVTSNPGATIVSPVLLCLAGVTGHIWALCYLYSGTRRHNTHTVFYLLLCTLIWTDFWGKLVTTPPAIISYAFGQWMGGSDMCQFHGFTMILVQQITHLTVAAMAVERLLAICHGYLYERVVTFSRCWYVLASIWVFSLLLCLLPLFGIGEIFLQYPFTWCYVNIHLCSSTPLRHRVFTTGLGVINVGCLLTVLACNVCVVGSLLRMRLSRQIPAHLSSARRPSVQRDQELQMVVLLGVITISFIVSWAPLNVILVSNRLWPPHLTREDHMQELVAIRLASISQILDPWVYIICRVLFKSRVWRCWRHVLVGRRWSRRRSHSFKIKSLAESHSDPAPCPASRPATDMGDDSGLSNGAPPPLGPTLRPPHAPKTPTAPRTPPPPPPDALFSPFLAGAVGGSVCGGGEAVPLARSVSLAIPIPLFICEHYTMTQRGEGHAAPCYPVPDGPVVGPQQALRARSCCLDHHLPLPLLPGVPRSHSWGSGEAGLSHRRSCSTQTLPGDAELPRHAHTPTPATTLATLRGE